MPHLAVELTLCEKYGWTLEYIRSMDMVQYRQVIEVTKAMNASIK